MQNGEGGEEPAHGGEIHPPPHLARLHLVAEEESGERHAGSRVRPFFDRVGRRYAVPFEKAGLAGPGGGRGFGGDVQGSAGVPGFSNSWVLDDLFWPP